MKHQVSHWHFVKRGISVRRDMKPRSDADASAQLDESGDAAKIIDELKGRLAVVTDQDLAEALRIGRSTVANWRRRNRIPKRYSVLVDEDAKKRLSAAFDYSLLSSDEQAALSLAIMRMHRNWLPQLDSYPEFLRHGAFIPVQIGSHLEKALFDLLEEKKRGGFESADQCLYSMVYREFFDAD